MNRPDNASHEHAELIAQFRDWNEMYELFAAKYKREHGDRHDTVLAQRDNDRLIVLNDVMVKLRDELIRVAGQMVKDSGWPVPDFLEKELV